MFEVDISPEAVEQLAHHDDIGGDTLRFAPTLRALSAALTQSQDHLDRWINTCAAQDQTLADMRVQLDQSRTETAAAYERAACLFDQCANPTPAQSSQHMARQYATAIRALATPDQSSALAAIEATAIARGMRKAAEIAHDHTPEKHSGATLASHVTGRRIESAILAAIPQGDTTND